MSSVLSPKIIPQNHNKIAKPIANNMAGLNCKLPFKE
jgi:hypothetical protein